MSDRPSRLGVAWTAGRLAGRRLLRREVGATDLALGEQLTAQLDRMKGLAMKVGQIVSYMDVPLPPAVQQELARLQTGEHGMPPARVREVIETAFGRPLESMFTAFDPNPVAAASIGQVHRATVGDQRVAVKVQYPEVSRSFDEDLGALRRFASLASLASAVDGSAIVDELGARLAEECEYLHEAAMQAAFARAFADDPQVRVPAVLRSYCHRTVLTTAWAEGDDFEALRRDPDDARRATVARTLVRWSYRSLLELAAIQADPHPGNYVFLPSGAVAFLDFGCVRVLEPAFVLALRRLVAALRDDDRPAFREAIDAMGVVGRPRRFDYDHFYRVMEHLHRPLLRPGFRITPEYQHEGLALNGPRSPNARTMAIPRAYVWVMRLQWGLWSVLGKLDVTCDHLDLVDELLARPLAPLVPPEGHPAAASPR